MLAQRACFVYKVYLCYLSLNSLLYRRFFARLFSELSKNFKLNSIE